MRDRDPLQLPAGQLQRVPASRPGDSSTSRIAWLAASAASLLVMPCSRSAPCITRPTRNTGLNDIDGLWKIAAIRRPRTSRRLALGQAGQLRAVQGDAAADRGADGVRQAEHGERGHGLARAAFPGQPHDLGRAEGQLADVDDLAVAEPHLEVP